jgi:hypothetical protein
MKKFDSLKSIYVIDDNISGGELIYTIRAYTKNKKVKINIEITDLDNDEFKTTIIYLNY